MAKLVIFDCDGVLVESEQLANQALVDCLSEIQIGMSLEEAIQRFRGRKLADCFAEVERTKNCSLPPNFEATFRQKMSEYFEARLRPVDGVMEAVGRISYQKCVASNGPLQKTRRNLEITGLHQHFGENIFSAYSIQKWKPEPDLFLHACEEMGSDPASSVVVEDSESGVQAALAGGFKVLAFWDADSSTDEDCHPIPRDVRTAQPRRRACFRRVTQPRGRDLIRWKETCDRRM